MANTLDTPTRIINSYERDIEKYADQINYPAEDHDGPTVDGTDILDYGLELVAEIGRPWAWILATGGPHIEIVADGTRSATLMGYWANCKVERSGDHIDTVLDYLIESAGYAR